MTPAEQEAALIAELMASDLVRQGAPEEFDARGCRAVLAMLACFWIVVAAALLSWLDFQPWAWACGALSGTR